MSAPSDRPGPEPAPPASRDRRGPARAGRIPFLNALPYFLHWDELERLAAGRWVPQTLSPRGLGASAERGETDAGLFAEADLARLEPEFEPLTPPGAPGGLGIANLDRVGSVLLFLRTAPGEAADTPSPADAPGRQLTPEEASRIDRRLVALTGESSTSARLLRILLEVRFGVRASYARGVEADALGRAAAALVIGDTALRWRQNPPAGFRLGMDLATAWHAWTGLPCVFARWGVRRSVSPADRARLENFLVRSLREAEPHLADLEAFRASPLAAVGTDLGSPESLWRYLRLIRYRLGDPERRAIELYREHLRRLDLLRADF